MFKQILIGVKFTEICRKTLQTCVELSKIHDSDLNILHVLDYRLKNLDEADPELKKAIADAQSLFDSWLKPLTNGVRNVTFQCFPGDPSMALCRIAREIKPDLIMIACHQNEDKEPLGRINYVGSTILENAPCPVLMIPFMRN